MSHHSTFPSTVFVVDNQAAYLYALQKLLKKAKLSFECFHTTREFLDQYDPSRHGCLIIKLMMPDMGGLELLKTITQFKSGMPVIILMDRPDIAKTVQAMKLGAMDVLLRTKPSQRLIAKIRQGFLEDTLRQEMMQKESCATKYLESLTPRELEIMKLLTLGRSSKEISGKLEISIRTVDFHRRNILEKMHVSNTVQLLHLVENTGIETGSSNLFREQFNFN